MCDFTKTNIFAWVGSLAVVGTSKLLYFVSCSIGFTLLVRIRASDSSRLNWSKDCWSLFDFPFWQKWRWYSIQDWSLPNQWDTRIYFGTSALHSIWYNDSNMSTRSTPLMFLLYCWTIWGHGIFFFILSFPHHLSNSPVGSTPTKFDAIINPLYRHYSWIVIKMVIHSASAIFHEIFACIKGTTFQTVQSNCTNGIYSFQFKVMLDI